jgi:hypothetical protein
MTVEAGPGRTTPFADASKSGPAACGPCRPGAPTARHRRPQPASRTSCRPTGRLPHFIRLAADQQPPRRGTGMFVGDLHGHFPALPLPSCSHDTTGPR